MTVPAPSPAPKPGSTAEDALNQVMASMEPESWEYQLLATVREALERQREERDAEVAAYTEDVWKEHQRADAAEADRDEWKDTAEEIGDELRRSAELRAAAEAEVRRLTEMVRGHHQSLAAIGGGPCICDICSASPSDGGGAK